MDDSMKQRFRIVFLLKRDPVSPVTLTAEPWRLGVPSGLGIVGREPVHKCGKP